MARHRKPGPKTAWQNRVHYNRAKCTHRLKPSQIENLTSADTFASLIGTRLNGFLTIKFSEGSHALQEFQTGTKRLSQWHRRWGGELRWIYVWEATGGFHVHALVHVPRRAWRDFGQAVAMAFQVMSICSSIEAPGKRPWRTVQGHRLANALALARAIPCQGQGSGQHCMEAVRLPQKASDPRHACGRVSQWLGGGCQKFPTL